MDIEPCHESIPSWYSSLSNHRSNLDTSNHNTNSNKYHRKNGNNNNNNSNNNNIASMSMSALNQYATNSMCINHRLSHDSCVIDENHCLTELPADNSYMSFVSLLFGFFCNYCDIYVCLYFFLKQNRNIASTPTHITKQ